MSTPSFVLVAQQQLQRLAPLFSCTLINDTQTEFFATSCTSEKSADISSARSCPAWTDGKGQHKSLFITAATQSSDHTRLNASCVDEAT